jgi:hypothetical protein
MTAVISACGKYRYRLEREVQPDGPVYAYFGINPSTADASIDDATVRKCKGFTNINGGSRFIVGNVFGYRATDVRTLEQVMHPCGDRNYEHIEAIAKDADYLVPCWGSRSKVPKTLHHHIDHIARFLQGFGKPIKIFGLTKSGDPMHPLMLGYDTPLIQWGKA